MATPAAKPEETTPPVAASAPAATPAAKPEETTPPVAASAPAATPAAKPEETITVTVLEKILHSGELYAAGAEITDTPKALASALETNKVKE